MGAHDAVNLPDEVAEVEVLIQRARVAQAAMITVFLRC